MGAAGKIQMLPVFARTAPPRPMLNTNYHLCCVLPPHSLLICLSRQLLGGCPLLDSLLYDLIRGALELLAHISAPHPK